MLSIKELAAYNSTYPKGGVSSPLDSLVVAESSVLRTNFCAKKPALRVAAKHYKQPMDSNNNEGTLRHKTKKPEIGLCLFWHISIFADTIRLHKEKCKRAKISLPFISPKKQSER
jgi:hypothetical protein